MPHFARDPALIDRAGDKYRIGGNVSGMTRLPLVVSVAGDGRPASSPAYHALGV